MKKPKKTAPEGCRLVSILQSGVEANEFALKVDGPTTIGRHGADVSFPEDLGLSDIHARILPAADGFRVRDEGSAEGVFLQPAGGRLLMVEPGAIIRAGRQWLVVGDDPGAPGLIHYDTSGRHVARHDLKVGTTMFGRQSPDVTIAPDDGSLSRRHFAMVVQDGKVGVKDLGSGNGTYVKVSGEMLLAPGDRIHLSRQVLQFTDERDTAEPEAKVSVDTTFYARQAAPPVKPESVVAPAPAAPAPKPAAPPPPAPAAKPAAAKPAAPAAAPPKPAAPPPAPVAAPAPPPAPAAAPDGQPCGHVPGAQSAGTMYQGPDHLRSRRSRGHRDGRGLSCRRLWNGSGESIFRRRASGADGIGRALDARGLVQPRPGDASSRVHGARERSRGRGHHQAVTL